MTPHIYMYSLNHYHPGEENEENEEIFSFLTFIQP